MAKTVKNSVDLSVILTAHDEGILAHRTILSVLKSLDHVVEKSYTFEIIVHIDNGTKETIEYFKRYEDDPRFVIFQNSFGDLGFSRNFAISKANGRFISVMDCDDIISENWFLGVIEKLSLSSNEKLVLHANANLTFGFDEFEPIIQFNEPSYGDERDMLFMLGYNQWHSFAAARREIFLENPYTATGDGYGHEDYTFNVNTLNKGIKHGVVERSILFYRRKAFSVSKASNGLARIQPYSSFFDFDKFRKIKVATEIKNNETKRYAYSVYKKIRNNDSINKYITPLAKVILNCRKALKSGKAEKNLLLKGDKSYVIDAWKEANVIDNELYPTKFRLSKLSEWSPRVANIGYAFRDLACQFTKKPDYVFVVPWIVKGGADKVLINYVKALKQIHPEWNILIITTLNVENKWNDKLQGLAEIVNFGKASSKLFEGEVDILFSRFITQLECKRIHIINSEFGYRWCMRHKELLRPNYEVFLSIFSYFTKNYYGNSGIYNYSTYAAEIFNDIRAIFTDNENVINALSDCLGFDKSKMFVHYQPLGNDVEIKNIAERKSKKLLWASRVSSEKRPELLKEIAKYLDDDVEIDVFGALESNYGKDFFSKSKNIHYKGEYNGFASLNTEDYAAFLYTSGIDGMPNVVLEATAAGLPVITTDAGGVHEFINSDTGILLSNESPAEIAKVINSALKNGAKLSEKAKNAQMLLKTQHSWSRFVDSVRKNLG